MSRICGLGRAGLYGASYAETTMVEQCLCQAMDLRNDAIGLFYGGFGDAGSHPPPKPRQTPSVVPQLQLPVQFRRPCLLQRTRHREVAGGCVCSSGVAGHLSGAVATHYGKFELVLQQHGKVQSRLTAATPCGESLLQL